MTALFVAVVVLAVVTAATGTAPAAGIAATLGAGGVVLAGCDSSRATDPARRERGWRLEVIGVALLAAAWLGATVVGQGGDPAGL